MNIIGVTSPFWKEHGDRFRLMVDAGMTPREISEALGCSKNAVMGRAWRQELTFATAVGSRGSRKPRTTDERLDELVAEMERVLEENRRRPSHFQKKVEEPRVDKTGGWS